MVFSCGGERLLRIMQCCAHASKCVLRIMQCCAYASKCVLRIRSPVPLLASVVQQSCSPVLLASVVLCLCQNHPPCTAYSLSLPFVLFFILHHQPDLLGKRPLQYSNVDNWPISSVESKASPLYYTIHGVIPIYCKIIKAFPLLYYTIHGVIPNYVIIPFHSSTNDVFLHIIIYYDGLPSIVLVYY